MSATHDLVLRDAQASQSAPGLSVIETLPEGSLVKLWAVDGANVNQGERFWARITHKNGRVWTGQTVNSMVFLKVAYGDRVRFNPTNVFDYEYPDHPNPT